MKTIFRAYDIRGIYPSEINEELAEKIGAAFGTMVKGKIVVGMDVRNSGPKLKDALVKGLLSVGVYVIDIGNVTTPMVYFAVVKYGFDGGIIITASHNPSEYNGFKLCGKNAISWSWETGIEKLYELVKSDQFDHGDGKLEKKDMNQEYADFIASKFVLEKPIKVVIDAGNASAGTIAPRVFEKMGCEVVKLYCEPDGSFPNHQPDPLKREALRDLQKRVVEVRADLGIAYDGDGDRVGFVDSQGNVIENNKVFALFIKDALKESPGSKVLYEVLCSKMIDDVIKQAGGVPVMSRVGHSYIHIKLLEENCIIGGETSAHYYFKDSFFYDDGIFASVAFAKVVSLGSVDEKLNMLPKYYTSDDTRINCPDNIKFDVVEQLKKKFQEEGKNVVTLDGAKVLFENSWFIARASNTQPAIVTRWEASTPEEFERVGEIVKREVENAINTIKNVSGNS